MSDKQTHFRIIELPTHQVLITKDWDDDEHPIVSVTFFLDGMKITQSLGYTELEKRDSAFESFNDAHAQGFLDFVLSAMKDSSTN